VANFSPRKKNAAVCFSSTFDTSIFSNPVLLDPSKKTQDRERKKSEQFDRHVEWLKIQVGVCLRHLGSISIRLLALQLVEFLFHCRDPEEAEATACIARRVVVWLWPNAGLTMSKWFLKQIGQRQQASSQATARQLQHLEVRKNRQGANTRWHMNCPFSNRRESVVSFFSFFSRNREDSYL
jgi:hypothetical protein